MPPDEMTATPRGLLWRDGDVTLTAEFCAPGIVRVRKWQGKKPPASLLMRYGFYRSDWPDVPVHTHISSRAATASSDLLTVRVDSHGAVSFADAGGNPIVAETEPALPGPDPGFRLSLGLSPKARLVGLGDQNRERLDQRGTKGDLWIRNVNAYIPIPFVMSSDGFGVLLDTTRRVFYDLGATDRDRMSFEAEDEIADWYFLYGPTPAEVFDRYTQVTGRPMMPPRWALGLWFICRTQANAREFTDDCLNFRRERIPCDCIGLEPGWMETNYDFSLDKKWSDERFRVPSYNRFRHTFFAAAVRMGFKPGLWLCNDYDLTWEEERRADPAFKGAGVSEERSAFAEGHEVDENLIAARRLDRLTRPEVPWYQHLTRFVDEHAHWFKQDGANQVLDHPDRLWGNGMTDGVVHNLYPLMYSRQMLQGYREHAGRRTFTFTCSGWAGLQALTGTWTGDTGGEEKPLIACLNLSLSGHGLNTCDMEVTTAEGIQFGMLLPWAQLNSWNTWRHPWLQGDRVKSIFTFYARLRYRLLPYIYSVAWQAHTTGMPMMRAMPVHWPDASDSYECVHQFLLGPSLLVASFTNWVWVPPGGWYSFWTGERLRGNRWTERNVPEDRGGPLLVPAGAIIPMGPEIDYVGQRPDDELTVHVWAGAPGSFTLYEDDGSSYDFEGGEFRIQLITQEPDGDGLRLVMEEPEGNFRGAVQERDLSFVVHGLQAVSSAMLDGEAVAAAAEGPRPNWHQEDSGDLTIALGPRDLSRIEIAVS